MALNCKFPAAAVIAQKVVVVLPPWMLKGHLKIPNKPLCFVAVVFSFLRLIHSVLNKCFIWSKNCAQENDYTTMFKTVFHTKQESSRDSMNEQSTHKNLTCTQKGQPTEIHHTSDADTCFKIQSLLNCSHATSLLNTYNSCYHAPQWKITYYHGT